MADSIRTAFRERLQPRTMLVWVAFLAVLLWFLDDSLMQLGVTLGTGIVLGVANVLIEVYDLHSAVESLGIGLVSLFGGVVLFVLNTDVGASIVLLLMSCWMVFDATQTLRHEGLRDDERHESRDGHAVYHDYVVRRVHETLRERALTRLELSKTLDADDEAIDRALETLAERGVLSRNGSELRVSPPPKPGAIGRVRNGITAAFSRLARPITIEFEDEPDDETGARRVGTTRNDDPERERESA